MALTQTEKLNNLEWIIQKGSIVDDTASLVEVIRRNGMQATEILMEKMDSVSITRWQDYKHPVILGSIAFVDNWIRHTDYDRSGVFADFCNYDCMTYYAYWAKFMHNDESQFMPFALLQHRFDELMHFYKGRFFLRPSSGRKNFTGMVIDRKIEIDYLAGRISPKAMVLVAPVAKPEREYRFFCCKNMILGGTEYFQPGEEKAPDRLLRNQAETYLRGVLEEVSWYPEYLYTVDIAHKDYTFSVLELNSFSCSGWYDIDQNLLTQQVGLCLAEHSFYPED